MKRCVISHPLPWVFGPLVYLYTLAASNASWRPRARDALHFVPAIVVIIATLPFYLMSGPDKSALFDRLQRGDVPTVLAVLSPFKYVSGLAYSVVTIRYLRHHRRRVENSYSNTNRVNLRWLLWLSGAAVGVWLLAVVIQLTDLLPEIARRPSGDLIALAIALLVYAIGYMGLRQPEIHRYDDSTVEAAADSPAAETRSQPVDGGRPRYERSGLGDAEATTLQAELVALMTREHPYRDPELTLPDLAQRLGTTPHKLSEVLNAKLGQTFYEFVNGYRVDDVRRRIEEGKSNHLKMLALAMDAGRDGSSAPAARRCCGNEKQDADRSG